MKHTFRRMHSHLQKHHKKYLFGLFGGYAVVKLFLLVLGLSAVQYIHKSTFAQLESGCVMTGEYYTGEYQTGCIEVPEEFSGGYLIDCKTIPGYFTGGTINDSGELVDRIWIEESQTGCTLTGYTVIPAYMTGCFMTGGYRTGGTLLCDQEEGTGVQEEETGEQEENNYEGNGVCESGDIIRSRPVSGAIVKDIFPVRRNYSGDDCKLSGLVLQLRDHNDQWLTIASLDSGTNQYSFDSKPLYSFQNSGYYHVISNTGVGDYMIYSGQYTGSYSRFFTGYMFRLLTPDSSPLIESSSFTIDNEIPTLTGIALASSGSTTGYLSVGKTVTLSFTASESLDDVTVTLGSKTATSSLRSGLSYTYTWTLNSLYPEGPLVTSVSFSDEVGNTGFVSFTGSFVFDMIRPMVTGFAFSESSNGLLLDFVGSEPIQYTLTYQKTGVQYATGKSTTYLTAHQALFSGIERNQLYAFTLDIIDQAGNSRAVTGEVTRTNLGQIISSISIVPATGDQLLTGNLATLAVTLKQEVEKFNACKNALSYTPVVIEVRRNDYTIHMPKFKKSQVKTLVSAFTLFVLDEIKGDYKITKADIEEITDKFDDFLVILKLLRDDDNVCKQNLSNYHINQFKKILEKYDINID